MGLPASTGSGIGITPRGSTTASSIVSFAVIQGFALPVVRAATGLGPFDRGGHCAPPITDRSLVAQALVPEVVFSVKLPIAG